MFDLSFAEITIVAIIALLVIGPKDLPKAISFIKKITAKVKNLTNEFTSSISDIDEISDLKEEANKINKDLKTIIDLDGNEQPTYDLSEIIDEIDNKKN